MSWPSAWSTFEVTVDQVKNRDYDVLKQTSLDNIRRKLTVAQSDVENELGELVFTKFKDKYGRDFLDYLPNDGQELNDALNTIMTQAFPMIRTRIILWTLYLIYLDGDDEDVAANWKKLYDTQDINMIITFISTDEDTTLDSDEVKNVQDLLDNFTI